MNHELSTFYYITKFHRRFSVTGWQRLNYFEAQDGKVFELDGDNVFLVGSFLRWSVARNWFRVDRPMRWEDNHRVCIGTIVGRV